MKISGPDGEFLDANAIGSADSMHQIHPEGAGIGSDWGRTSLSGRCWGQQSERHENIEKE
jgi:hypothetical protein